MVSVWLYLALLGVVGLERLFELSLSRRNLRALRAKGAVEVGQGHFPVMVALHTAFLFSCGAEVWIFARPFTPWLGAVALAVTVAAQALRYWAVTTLGERWNTRVVVLPGAEPVVGGPYRFVRHPNYLAVVLELIALPLVHGAWATAVVFTLANAWLLSVRIRVEEQALGERWAAAFGRTPGPLPRGDA